MRHAHTIIHYNNRYNYVQKLRIILVMTGLLSCFCVRAQYDPNFSHYFDIEPQYNPAAVGKESKLNVSAAYALNMMGFEHNPRTLYIAADIPFYALKTYHGAGIQLQNDQIGAFVHQRLAVQYALKHPLFGGTLSVGVQAGFLSEKLDGSKIDLEDSSDPAFAGGDQNGNSIDLSAGLYYTRGPWYVGASVQHITAPLIELGETNELKIDPTYYFTGGYNIKLRNPFLTIHPSLFFRTDGNAYRGDVTARVVYRHENKMMYAGLGGAFGNSYKEKLGATSVTAYIGGSFHGINLGYSYELYTSAISPANGSHELVITYQTDINLTKKGKNKHKSVRYL